MPSNTIDEEMEFVELRDSGGNLIDPSNVPPKPPAQQIKPSVVGNSPFSFNFDPNQPRDKEGQFTDSGGVSGIGLEKPEGTKSVSDIKALGFNVIGFDGVDNKIVDQLHTELSVLKNDFPGIESQVTSIKVGKLEKHVPATMRKEGGSMSLIVDPSQFNEATNAKIASAKKRGFLVSENTHGLVAHEVAHFVDLAPNPNVQAKWSNYQTAKKYIRQNPPTTKDLSKYGTTDKHEAFAEAYSAYRVGKSPTKWQQGFNDAMKGLVKNVLFTSGEESVLNQMAQIINRDEEELNSADPSL